MKLISRLFVLLALIFTPAVAAATQATPAAPSRPPVQVAPPVAAAKDAPSAFGNGVGSTATWFDSRGNPVLTFTVTSLEMDWQEYDAYSAPEVGKMYVAVHLELTNPGTRALTVNPYQFTLVDTFGAGVSNAYIYDNPDIWSDDVAIGAGETLEGTIVYAIYSDVEPLMLLYMPDYSTYLVIYLGE